MANPYSPSALNERAGGVGGPIPPSDMNHARINIDYVRYHLGGSGGTPFVQWDDGGSNEIFLSDDDGTTKVVRFDLDAPADSLVVDSSGNVVLGGDLDMGTTGNRIDLNTDNDTSVRASSAEVIAFECGGADVVAISGADRSLGLNPFDNGTGPGPVLKVDQNNNGSTPAAGAIRLRDLNGTDRYLWFDASGNVRKHTSQPTNSTDTNGTVVG